jgi:hypothetical protein
VEALLASLESSLSMQSKALLADVADTMVPGVKRVKQAHKIMNDEMDHTYGAGIVTFNKRCKDTEMLTRKYQKEIKEAYKGSQVCA